MPRFWVGHPGIPGMVGPIPCRYTGLPQRPPSVSLPEHPVKLTKEFAIKSEELVQLITRIIADKKAEEIVALDLRGISSFTDFFVICTGNSEPHLKAILSDLQEQLLKEHNVRAHAVDGSSASRWIIADFSDVIVHIFHQDLRHVYSLEDLWSDAPRVSLKP